MANVVQRSFAKGELAPALHARVDTAAYEVGLRTCRNFMVMRQGGATKRPGTEYICAVKTSAKRVRLIPFVFNVRQSLVLEFGDLYIRFIQAGGVVVDPVTPANSYEIVSPYLEADLPALQYVQSGDVVTLVHPSYAPRELKRLANDHWTLTAITFGSTLAAPTGVAAHDLFTLVTPPALLGSVSYVVTGVNAAGEESLQSAAATSDHIPTSTVPQHVTGTAAGADTYNVYRRDSATGVYGFVGSGIGTTIDFEDWGAKLPDITLQPPIAKTLFASADNYPSVVAYYQQRLIFANSNNAPDTVWCSRTGQYHNFNVSAFVEDDDAITFRLVSSEIDAVRTVLDVGRLIIGTEGAEWIIEGDGNGVLTPTSVNARIGSTNGVGSIRPVKADSRLLFVQSLGSDVRELQSNVQFGYYTLVGADIMLFSSHLIDGFAIVDWAWQHVPTHVLWAVRSDGVLLGLTYIPEQEVLGWHRHDSKGFIENVCVVPEGRSHWMYWVAKRLINGTYRRYIERMTTTNVLPVFETAEGGLTGPIVTPPPPPPPPPPSGGPLAAPTDPSTTDIGTTGATANWSLGNAIAPVEVQIREQGGSESDWVSTTLPGGTRSYNFTHLISGAQRLILAHAGPTIPSSAMAAHGLTWYETLFSVNAEQQWTDFGPAWDAGNTISEYERPTTYYMWWVRTGDPKWLDRANQLLVNWRDNYLIPAGYNPSPHYNQAESLYLHWLITGDTVSRDAILTINRDHFLVWWPKIDDLTNAGLENRVQVRVLMAMWMVEKVTGAPYVSTSDYSDPTSAFYGHSLDTLVPRVLALQNVDGSFTFPINTCGYSVNYQSGMLADFMTRLYDQRAGAYNAAILAAMIKLGDFLWNTQWRGTATPSDHSFNYMSGLCVGSGSATAAPDENGLIAPLFGWLGKTTGNAAWFTKGDQVLNGMQQSAGIYLYRQFSEQFSSSYRYLGYRYGG